MAAQLKLDEYTPVFGPRVANAFLDFQRDNGDAADEPEVPAVLPNGGDIGSRIIIDADIGMLRYRPTLDDILIFSKLTGDHNSVHKADNPYFGKALVQGNLVAALAESLVAAYFDRHHFSHVDSYFNSKHSWLPQPFRKLFSKFAVRNKYIGKLSYTFRDEFYPGDELELKVANFEFRKTIDNDCKFSVTCNLSHPAVRQEITSAGDRYKPGLIKVEYDLVLPQSPKLSEVSDTTPLCTDEVELRKEDFDLYVTMLSYTSPKLPVMFPVVSTNSRILLKRLAEMKVQGSASFGTGIYQSYKTRLFKGARKVKLGDRLRSFYFRNGMSESPGVQSVRLFVTDSDDNVLYEFNAPILLLQEKDQTKVN